MFVSPSLPLHFSLIDEERSAVLTLPEEALETHSYAELAPLFCAGATVFDAIRTTKWCPGDICIVQGVGGLGHLGIQVGVTLMSFFTSLIQLFQVRG